MKRLATVVLLLVFMMYQAGYYLFYLTLKHHHDQQWLADLNLRELGNKIIKRSIPISLPYQPDQIEFQSVMQSIEIDGQFYQVIMQRYAHDTLNVFYVADTNRANLHSSLREWVNTISQPSSQNNKNSVIRDGLEKNYLPNSILINLCNTYIQNPAYGYVFVSPLIDQSIEKPTPPPESSGQESES